MSAGEGIASMPVKELSGAVAFAAKVLPGRPVAPVLGGMLVGINDARITFGAFDYEVSARISAGAETGGAGTVLVDGRELAAAVRALPKGSGVTALLALDDAGLAIECGTVSALIPKLAELEEYPQLPGMPEAAGYVDGAAFARSVARVAPLVAKEADRVPVLENVQFTAATGTLTLTATDRYRVAFDDLAWSGDESAGEFLVPGKALGKFAKTLARDGKVSVHLFRESGRGGEDYGFAGFSDGTRQITIALRYGTYPDMRKRRDGSAAASKVSADGPALAAAVSRAITMTGTGRWHEVKLAAKAGGITVIPRREDGKDAGTLPVAGTVTGPEVTCSFNGSYLLSMLEGIAGTVVLGINGTKPVAVDAPGDTYSGLVMPVRES